MPPTLGNDFGYKRMSEEDDEILIQDGNKSTHDLTFLLTLAEREKHRPTASDLGAGDDDEEGGHQANDNDGDDEQDAKSDDDDEAMIQIDPKMTEMWKSPGGRAKVDEGELRAALQRSLRGRVRESERERWMFEVESESEGSV